MSRALWGAALLLYGGLIFWLSSCPLPEGPPLFPFQYGDKLLHFLEYLLFGFLAWKTFLPQQKKGIAFVLLVSIAYAGSDELHQLFVPTRAASFRDWGTDSLGIMGGLLFGYRLDGGYLHF